MQQSDYPFLFQSSDLSSLIEQKTYVVLSKIDFGLIVLAAFFSGFSFSTEAKLCKYYAIAALIALILSFCFKLIIQIGRWDRKWFDTRAIAESVKTTTWRYITAAEPYNSRLSSQEADKKFLRELTEILKSRPDAPKSLAKCIGSGQQISDRMREIRQLDLKERKDIYLQQRIMEQKDWYSRKASYNVRKETTWFWVVLGTEVLAILCAIYMINNLNISFNPIGVLTTLVVVFSAWAQIKKHRELSQSYSLAAQELSVVESLTIHIEDEEALSDYVISAENAISKEHTMWCAKRV